MRRPASGPAWLRRIRLTVTAVAVALVATACAGGTGDDGEAAAQAGRTITHAMGSSVVPADPKRVVVLDTQELDAALSLGVVPVGAVSTAVDEKLPAFLQGKAPAEKIENVGTIQSPNLEAIAALKPDLILSSKLRHEDIYPQLSAIAPTVFAERTGDAWKDNLLLFAEALGRKAQAEQQLAAYESRAKAIGERVGAVDTSVGIVRFNPGEIRLYSPRSFIGTVLADAGFARPDIVRNAERTFVKISPEEIGSADADVIFTSVYGPAEDTGRAQATELWGTLAAVRAGKVFEVSDDTWMLAIGLTGANLVLDDIEHLLGS
ncbi:ABC transporter substrate-binding protein [Pseudonocardia asaccharolytica]|uniref:ABC transporter periplasmic component n=1 Tax=Pseudonocardia asaccharolytica DSM 44247 = NBRC 16224 TaxID=1123024 RepID=A0A511D889_9PSEU|nr:iron-siderophore ABC transporter substrate-binding protein [Pseudonocardia asaccharolytica]GEL20837.1 ABC transporter periplasmic component [Pseudonocardia asaccharolytica DSM 44247 = NBRC 16224]